jgi:hypothetical protein
MRKKILTIIVKESTESFPIIKISYYYYKEGIFIDFVTWTKIVLDDCII